MKLYHTNLEGPHDQALIIDEETGRNVAVVYDKKDAPLLAASADLLEACKMTLAEIRKRNQCQFWNKQWPVLESAVNKAEENNSNERND